jgi:hypothetical protein
MHNDLRLKSALLATLAAAALAAVAGAQVSPVPQESPWAMRAPAAPVAGATPGGTAVVEHVKAEPMTREQKEFAHRLFGTIYDKDLARMRELIAPGTLKCIGTDKEAFLDSRLKREFTFPISEKYRFTVTTLPKNVGSSNRFATFPVPATHLLGMDFSTGNGGSVTLNEMIGQENGKWYLIQPCPTELGMQRYKKQQERRAIGLARAKTAYARVQEPLKSQLMAYIKKRDDADAWKLCMKSLNVDFETAREVVALLAGDPVD